MKKQNRKPNNNIRKIDSKFAYSPEEIKMIDREIEMEKKREAERLADASQKSHVKAEHAKAEHLKTEHDENSIRSLISHARKSERYKVRLGMLITTLAFVLIAAMAIGTGMAMIELQKTPADFFDLFRPTEAMAKELYDELYPAKEETSVEDDFSGSITFDEGDSSSKEGESEEKSSEVIATDEKPAEDNASEAESDNPADSFDEDATVVIAEEEPTDKENLPDNVITQQEADETSNQAEDASSQSDLFDMDQVKMADASDDSMTDAMAYDSLAGMNINDLYPLPFTTVDESYFEDALLIGDSRFLGFAMWSGLPATNYCITSFSIFNIDSTNIVPTENGKVPIFQALPYDAFTKIYIKVGLNEMGTKEEVFEAKYAEVIARLREQEPRAVIYVNAILPVTAAKSQSDKTHNNTNIAKRNAALKQFAESQKAYFIDAGPYVSGEDGALKSEMTNDGIHMGAKHMGIWKQCLMEHAIRVD